MDINCGIYKITNIVNEKFYIGSSCNIRKRWNHHRCLLNNNKHDNRYLQASWNKHGEENFIFEIIEECEDDEKILMECEQRWLDLTQCYNHEIGYNIHIKTNNEKLSDETKDWISIATRGSKNGFSKLQEEQVDKMRELYHDTKITLKELADMFGVSLTHVCGIINGVSWKHCEVLENDMIHSSEKRSQSKIEYKDAQLIREMYKDPQYSQEKLARMFGVSRANIESIIQNKSWHDPEYVYVKKEVKQVAWNKGIPHTDQHKQKLKDNHHTKKKQ